MTQSVESDTIGTTPSIQNALSGSTLDTAILTDPAKIQAFKDSIASQMNAQSNGPTFEDLSDRIGNVSLEGTAQGASILVVPLIDPMWVVPNSGFISVDDQGFIWPPIDVNFPAGSKTYWRLCQVEMIWDATETDANVTFTFEDRIVSILREMSSAVPGALSQGAPNQTLMDFIQSLVDNTNQVMHLTGNDKIELVRLIDRVNDPSATVAAPATAALGNTPPGSDPPKRDPTVQGLTRAQQGVLDGINSVVSALFSHKEQMRIQDAENFGAAKAAQLQQRGSQVWATPGSGAGNVP